MGGIDVLRVTGQVGVCVKIKKVGKHLHVSMVSREMKGGK